MACEEPEPLLPSADKAPDNGQKPITRALVLELLYDPDEDPEEQYVEEDNGGIDIEETTTEVDFAPVSADTILQETRSWLEALADEQQAETDSTSDCETEEDPTGNESPSLGVDGDQGDEPEPTIHVQPSDMGMNTEVLHRIREEEPGPRPPEGYDLIANLRLGTPKKDDTSEETYAELLEVVQAWNLHVGSIPDLTEERDEFLQALRERHHLIKDVEQHKRERAVLDEPPERLQRAMRAYRPEIAKFENQNTFDILVMMIANLRIANPDLDEDVKDAVIWTIFMEVWLPLCFEKQYRDERAKIQQQVTRARENGNREDMGHLTEEKKALDRKQVARAVERAINYMKFTRNELRRRVEKDTEQLALLQTGQKWFASEVLSLPKALAEQKRAALDAEAERTFGLHFSDHEAECEVEGINIADLVEMGRRCVIRTEKFAAKDIKDKADRERVKRARMEEPGTATMMLKILEDTDIIKAKAQRVVRRMTGLESSLDATLAAAKGQYREYDAWLESMPDEVHEWQCGQ
ncbi:hypothetical protein BU26DRAFT_342765 [Trematosphaeria pertusa]|uniref:Uncharacterized protein n=1 Tax=Trematosphaeria pertusa TaxID=390896 RepID=A0A6A6IA71_9PLEO|nr:uncharacterized protein BU26DRAFT_342765 [Trematosphaeria pertusa]KAF2247139.1 hypothetical protein BU26DRAFT_342765 [Trematosphaeria pertusa]